MKKLNWRKKSRNHADREDFTSSKKNDPNSEDTFKLQVPKFYKENIDFNNVNDPLLLQVLPSTHEQEQQDGYSIDPVADLENSPHKGIIHKYYGRVLLIASGTCAINCRYCFRRNFPYSENYASKNNWQESLKYIQENPDIHEVILSGGDPLMLSTKTLKRFTDQLQLIDHVKTLRVHTRLPLVTPSRITKNFTTWLSQVRLKKVMVVHCNHPNELPDPLKNTIKKIIKTNTLLLNQSVLLKGINDNAETLIQLSHRLFELEILPYYINLLDKAKGTHHFEVDENQAKFIYKQIQSKLPGYLVPRLVQDIMGKKSKTLAI
jgi:EF-P beta-lysylation protein EpmB